jgi:hypothetical protein
MMEMEMIRRLKTESLRTMPRDMQVPVVVNVPCPAPDADLQFYRLGFRDQREKKKKNDNNDDDKDGMSYV